MMDARPKRFMAVQAPCTQHQSAIHANNKSNHIYMDPGETQVDTHEFYVTSSVFLRESRPSLWGEEEGKVVIVKLPIFEFPKELLM